MCLDDQETTQVREGEHAPNQKHPLQRFQPLPPSLGVVDLDSDNKQTITLPEHE